MASDKKLKQKELKRRNIMDSVDRIAEFSDNYDPERDVGELPLRLERLEKYFELFETIQTEYEVLDDTDQFLKANLRTRARFEELYFRVKANLITKMPQAAMVQVPIPSDQAPVIANTGLSNIKLPTIKLPEFSGDFNDWLTFHDTFLALIHSSTELTTVQKFHYLRASLKGEAARLTETLTITTANYAVVWQTLLDRYSNKYLLKKKHIQALLDYPKIKKQSSSALHAIVDEFQRHTQILEQLQEPVEHWSSLLVEVLTARLDDLTLTAWEEIAAKEEHPTFANSQHSDPVSQSSMKRPTPKMVSHAAIEKTQYRGCPACNQRHLLTSCSVFHGMPLKERLELVNNKALCRTNRISSLVSNCGVQSNSHVGSIFKQTNVFLSTVSLKVSDSQGREQPARALLDSCSQANIISERLCKRLRLKRHNIYVDICGIGHSVKTAKHSVSARIKSRCGSTSKLVHFIVLENVTTDLPAETISVEDWNISCNLELADPNFNISGEIDLVIGAEHYFSFIRNGRIRLSENLPVLVESDFGWLVTGLADVDKQGARMACNTITLEALDAKLERFWLIEENFATTWTVEEQQCEKFYSTTTTRSSDGRYVVRLPKRSSFENLLGDSKPVAIRRFHCLEAKLQKDPPLRVQYNSFMAEYLQLGHMHPIPYQGKNEAIAFYLPHHPVIKKESTTTKIRVVFDGSAKTTSGHSLNDLLQVGPVLQDELISIVLRFRLFHVAIVADIEKMYRQILVHPDDQPLQRIFWRFDPSEELTEYQLSTVTYGLAPSSFLAIRTLYSLADDYERDFPAAAVAIKKGFYVDDFLHGAPSVESAIQLRDEMCELLHKGGFRLRKWCSNFKEVLQDIPPELRTTQSELQLDPDESIKTLGILWEPALDVFRLVVNVKQTGEGPTTKRNILSTIAQLYDPLGIISPVTITAKILMQQLWLLPLGWDEEVPSNLKLKWEQYTSQLSSLSAFSINRFVLTPHHTNVELHIFADASEVAYGACVYVRSWTTGGAVTVTLLVAKARVAPLQRITIPRLELCAAVVAARLFDKSLLEILSPEDDSTIFYMTSKVK
ncbi:uncharacterized protein LOC131680793 [Topomyia yanbarensis]|uniref:uncharacterized protein LOC131680793 n=1 Tax=Topomyia yanbarensis TaxID=2498891 RepID=UPI00273BE906|nr:uncharacterized protein LOC131680793 [Topomyia yanbarensis]